MLTALCTRFGGGPVGLTTLAVAVGEEPETVETVAEPFLVREGLVGRTPRGRIALPAAWAHLGLDGSATDRAHCSAEARPICATGTTDRGPCVGAASRCA